MTLFVAGKTSVQLYYEDIEDLEQEVPELQYEMVKREELGFNVRPRSEDVEPNDFDFYSLEVEDETLHCGENISLIVFGGNDAIDSLLLELDSESYNFI